MFAALLSFPTAFCRLDKEEEQTMRRSSAARWLIFNLFAGLVIDAGICFAQGGGAGGASGPGTSTGGISGGTGGISGGGISTGGVLGGISGGGTANQIGPGGNAGASGSIGAGSSGIHEGVVPTNPSGIAPNSPSPGRLPGNGSSRRYSLPRSRDFSDPLGLGGRVPSSRKGRGRAGRPEDLGPAGRAVIGDAMKNYDVWKGVAYFPRKGMYEDMIYGTNRGTSYRGNSGGRPTLSGGPARRAGVLGDRSINREGIPRTLRRVTPRQQPNRVGYSGGGE
jgi:hypothetical protein